MARRGKLTGCGKFILFLIIVAPLAYLGAAYYNGQDGIQNIKNFLGIGETSQDTNSQTRDLSEDEWRQQLSDKDKEIGRLQRENDDMKTKLDELENRIQQLETEIAQLKGN